MNPYIRICLYHKNDLNASHRNVEEKIIATNIFLEKQHKNIKKYASEN